MNPGELNRALSAGRDRAFAYEGELAAIYATQFRRLGRTAAEKFSRIAHPALVAAGDDPNTPVGWVPPDVDELLDQLAFDASSAARAAAVHAKALEAAFPRISTAPSMSSPFALPLLEQIGTKSVNLGIAARDVIIDVIGDSYAQGLSVPDTARALRSKIDHLSQTTAVMQARTDLNGIANGASLASVMALGDDAPAFKRWLATEDERTRETHVEADGQVVPIAQPFNVGDESLMYPGDPTGSDGEVINCRCTLVYTDSAGVIAAGELAIYDEAKHPRDPGGEGGGRWIPKGTVGADDTPAGPPAEDDLARQVLGGYPDTQAMYAGDDGGYTEERVEQWHDPLQARYLIAATPGQEQPATLFLAGGSGAGKSTILNLLDDSVRPTGAVMVNPDLFKEALPEYRTLVEGGSKYASVAVHEESSDIAKGLLTQAVKGDYHAIVDGTGDSGEGKFLAKINAQEALGRKVTVVMVDIPTDVAIERADARAARSGRYVPHAEIRKIHRSVARNHLVWRDRVADWQVWSNDDKPRLIARRVNGDPIEVLDPARYAQALAKGEDDG